MSDERSTQVFYPSQVIGRVLFASDCTPSEPASLRQQLSKDGYQVEGTGIGEALWLWPLAGFDHVLIVATEQPQIGIELCRHIKSSCPAQRVAVLLGDRAGSAPRHLAADAIWSGAPTEMQLLAAIRLLLAPRSFCTNGEVPKGPVRASVSAEHAKENSA